VESVDGDKNQYERLFEATKFALAHIPLEGAAPLQTSPLTKQQKTLPVEEERGSAPEVRPQTALWHRLALQTGP